MAERFLTVKFTLEKRGGYSVVDYNNLPLIRELGDAHRDVYSGDVEKVGPLGLRAQARFLRVQADWLDWAANELEPEEKNERRLGLGKG